MRVKEALPLVGLAGAILAGCQTLGFRAADYHPRVDPADFETKVDNPYYPLVPGTRVKLIETLGRETTENEITVTRETKTIMGVACVVVHDRVLENGVVREDTFDWMAPDNRGNVWYFGEATKEFKAGGRVSTEGSWEAGVGGAQPGIIMPAQPKPGQPYYQEYSLGVAEDIGQIVAVGESVTVPYGSFSGCVRTREWSLLESGSEKKWYAPGVGLVRTESTAGEVAKLVSVTHE